jgi:hypothetical protein
MCCAAHEALGIQMALSRNTMKGSKSKRSRALRHRFHFAGDERDRGVADPADDRMSASAWEIGYVPGPQLARFIEIRSFDHKEQLVTNMLVPWQLRSGLPTRHRRASLRGGITPERLQSNARYPLGPRNVAQHDRLRGRRGADLFRLFDSTGDNREDRRAILACHAVDTSVGTITDAARRDHAGFVAD